jgi:tetratricopeptide (TPR) repeat protein
VITLTELPVKVDVWPGVLPVLAAMWLQVAPPEAIAAASKHRACQRAKGEDHDRLCSEVREQYRRFLEVHPDDSVSDDMRFFLAELDFDNLGDFEDAVPLYRRVAEGSGRFAHLARYDVVLAFQELRRSEQERTHQRSTSWDLELIGSCDRFVAQEPEDSRSSEIALKAAQVALEAGNVAEAERRWTTLRENWPASIEAETALTWLGRALGAEHASRRLVAESRALRESEAEKPRRHDGFAAQLVLLSDETRLAGSWAEAAALAYEAALIGDRPDMMMGAVDLYLKAGHADYALDAAEELLRRWHDSEHHAHALLISSMLHQRFGHAAQARQRFDELGLEPEPIEAPAEPIAQEPPEEPVEEAEEQ